MDEGRGQKLPADVLVTQNAGVGVLLIRFRFRRDLLMLRVDCTATRRVIAIGLCYYCVSSFHSMRFERIMFHLMKLLGVLILTDRSELVPT